MQAVSVIVPVFNAEATLEACVKALEAQDYPAELREFIFVDNNSTDGSVALLHRWGGLRVLHEPHQGPAAARNCGARAASHPVLVFTDSDCLPEPGWLRALVSALEQGEVDVAGGEIVPFATSRYIERRMWEQGFLVQQRMIQRESPFPFCISANLAVWKQVFEEAGGFSLDYPLAAGEDLAFGYTLASRGARFGYVPDAIVRHHHRTSWRDLYRQFRRYGTGSAQFYALHAKEFPAEKVWEETHGQWPLHRDVYALSRIAKHWLLRTPAKADPSARRYEELLFDYCVSRGWQKGKEALGAGPNPAPGVALDSKKPVLSIMLTPCCWREFYVPFIKLGQQLEQHGYSVYYLAGHGGDCTFFGTLKDWDAGRCGKQFELLRKEAGPRGYRVLNDFLCDAFSQEAQQFVQQHAHTPYAQLQFRGLNVWEVVRGSICREMKQRLSLTGDETIASHPLLEKYARAMVTGYLALSRYLDEVQPNAVMVFNGFFYQERLLSELAHQRGCRVLAHENSCFRDRKIFSTTGYVGNWTDAATTGRYRLRAREISEAQRQQVHHYLYGVFSGKLNTIGQSAPETEAEVRRKIGVGPDTRIALLIGQVPFDVVMVYDLCIFEDMLSLIHAACDYFRDRPDYTLVVRLHPFEEIIGDDRTWKQLQGVKLPDNVRLLHSADVNTYSLMEIASFGIASTSQAGLEMAAMGKPVMLVGDAFYGRQGFTYDVKDTFEFRHTLSLLCDSPEFTPAMQRAMERFLYYLVFEYQVPYERDDWAFSESAVAQIAGMLGLTPRYFVSRAQRVTLGRAQGARREIPVGPDSTGWTGLGATLEWGEDGALICTTDAAAWSGAAYGCERANACDGLTLPVSPRRSYVLRVEMRALAEEGAVPVQLHVIGNAGANYGVKKGTLGPDWRLWEVSFRTGDSATHLGIQLVKAGAAGPFRFAVRKVSLESEFSWLDLV